MKHNNVLMLCMITGAVILFQFGTALAEPDQREMLGKKCGLGDVVSCFNLGVMWHDGTSGTKDLTKAREFFEKACVLRDGDGCFDLGMMWKHGEGGPIDQKKAAGFFEKACECRSGSGCTNLGLVYDGGQGVAKDPAKARGYYSKGCDLGDWPGCYNLGALLINGEGGPKDEVRAREVLAAACNGNYTAACNILGVMWANGVGGSQESSKASELLQKSCNLKDEKGCLALEKMRKAAADKPTHFCRHYTGTINTTIKVRMNLCAHPGGDVQNRDAAVLVGSYFYESKGVLLYLNGTLNGDGTLALTEESDLRKETGKIVGKIAGKNVTGRWKTLDGRKSFNVELKEDYTNAVELKTIYVEETHRYKGGKTGPELQMTWLVVQPATTGCAEACRKIEARVLETLFGKDLVPGADLQGNIGKAKAAIVKAFDEDNAEIEKEPGGEDDKRPAHDWSSEWEVRPVFNDYNILTLDFYSSDYTGGAHGSYNDTFVVFDAKTGERIGYSRIFNDNAAPALSKLMIKKLDAYFKKQIDDYKGLKDVLMDGDLKVVKPNDNFFVTSGGVGFHFNIYEITPYAVGSFDAFIPFGELKGLIREDSPISHLIPAAAPAKP